MQSKSVMGSWWWEGEPGGGGVAAWIMKKHEK